MESARRGLHPKQSVSDIAKLDLGQKWRPDGEVRLHSLNVLNVGAVIANHPPPTQFRANGIRLKILLLSSASSFLTCETILPDRAVEADRCYFDISIYMSSYAEQGVIVSEPVQVS